MGKFDRRNSQKMKRRKSQAKLKARKLRQRIGDKTGPAKKAALKKATAPAGAE